MPAEHDYPGTPAHQTLLAAVVAHYQADPRIRAVGLFGSLSRGNWDAYSDADLDVVVADAAAIDVPQELERLSQLPDLAARGPAFVVADGPDAGDIVWASGLQVSVRYHPLATTKAAIVDSLRVLWTTVDPAAIAAAGRRNPAPAPPPPAHLLNQCVRYVVGAAYAVQRGQRWAALDLLHRVRALLMELYALTHGGGRSVLVFQATAPPDLQERLGGTLAALDIATLQAAVTRSVDLLECDLAALTAGQVELTVAHRAVLAQVRARHFGYTSPQIDEQPYDAGRL